MHSSHCRQHRGRRKPAAAPECRTADRNSRSAGGFWHRAWGRPPTGVDHRKVMRHQRAKVGHRAARINKGQKQRLALELAQMNYAPILVAQLDVGHFRPGLARGM